MDEKEIQAANIILTSELIDFYCNEGEGKQSFNGESSLQTKRKLFSF